MKITAAAIHHYRLPLRANWLTATGDFGEREGWLLRLDTDSGARAYGDCAPLPGSAAETPACTEAHLRTQARRLIGMRAIDALRAIEPHPGGLPAARLALETALLDLAAQAAGVPLAGYLRAGQRPVDDDGRPPTGVAVNAALGSVNQIDDEHVRGACDQGFRVLKLKVGMASIDSEIGRLRRLAMLLPPGVELRLDANRAWGLDDAERFLCACARLPIEMIEEPLARPTLQELQTLQAGTRIAIAIDESISRLDVEQLLSRPPVRRLVIKPTRAGGLLPALHLARRAASLGLECVVTSSIESACGVTVAAHLAAAIDNRLAHGLATSSWLASDTGAPPAIVDGRLMLPRTAGLGFLPGEAIAFAEVAPPWSG